MKKRFLILLVFSMVVFLSTGWAFAQAGTEDPELPAMVMTILSIVAPPIWQFFVKRVKQEQIRYIILLVLCALTGVGTMLYLKEPIAFNLAFIQALFFWSSASYKLVWKILFNTILPSLKAVPSESFKI